MDSKVKHIWYKCPKECNKPSCMFCVGGLGHCTVCDGFEGSLTADCCGFKLDKYIQEAVYKGGLDYKDGQWSVKNG